jgi:predicted membrane channel-forming protein YqfA (hemolysin III family)
MAPDLAIERLHLAVAVALALAGVVTAWTSANAAKRLVGLLVAMMGALIGLAVLGMPAALLIAGAGAAFAMLIAGAALLVRGQESYGAIEAPELDAADAQSEAEPDA